MFTSAHANRSAQASAPAGHYAHRSGEQNTNGLISEIVYREDQPMMTQLLLLPLLQQLGQQSRWQLWLTPQQKLSREWVQSAGLPLSKVMQISQLSPSHTIDSMIRALRTGNYSVVICWLAEELTADEHERLVNAARGRVRDGIHHAPGAKSGHARQTTQRVKNSLKFVSLSEIRIILEFLPLGKVQRFLWSFSRNACHTGISVFFRVRKSTIFVKYCVHNPFFFICLTEFTLVSFELSCRLYIAGGDRLTLHVSA